MQKHEVFNMSILAAVALPVLGGYQGYKFSVFLNLADKAPHIILAGMVVGIAVAAVAIWFLHEFGDDGYRGAPYKRWLRGAKIVNWHSLKSLVDRENFKFNKERKKQGLEPLAPIMIGFMPMPLHLENRNTLICASVGAGKSVSLEGVIFSAIKRQDKGVIVDPNGTFYSKFSLPGDVILNPFDARSQGWSVFNEIRGNYDFDRMAKSIIPPQINPEDEQWCTYTRDVLSDTMRKLAQNGNRSQDDLINMLVREDTATVREFLANTDSQGYFRDDAEKAIASVQFMINKYVRPLRLMSQVSASDFSLYNWIHDPRPGNLYISWREDMRSAQRPLVAAWIDTICATLLSFEPMKLNRFWMFLDELESLGRLESFVPAATKGRKHGLRIVASIQDWAQLDEMYGKDAAKTLLACFRNYLIFGASNAYNADKASQILGQQMVERLQVTNSIKGGSSRNVVACPPESVVMDSEISTLRDLTGYVMFAEDLPIAKIKIPYVDYPVRHQAIQVH